MEVVATSLLPRGYRYDISYGDICYVNIFALVLIKDRWEKYILNNFACCRCYVGVQHL